MLEIFRKKVKIFFFLIYNFFRIFEKKRVVKPKIEKLNEENYLITKNSDFIFMFNTTYVIYWKFIEDFEKISKKKYVESTEFINLIVNIRNDKKISLLSGKEIKLLSDWIDSICNLLLEKETIDLKNEDLNKYFKIASEFNKLVTKLIQ